MLSKNQIKEIQALQLRKQRELRQLFLAEGAKTVSEVLQTRPDILEGLYATTDFLHKHSATIQKHQLKAVEITEDELHKISLQSSPNQALAVCRYFEPSTVTPKAASAFYLDDIRDPGNLGTIIRLCDWFGMTIWCCSPESCEQYNPKVIQATMGAFLRIKVVYGDIKELKAQFPHRYGAVLQGKDVYKEQLLPGLIVIGNEANGIGEQCLLELTTKLTIPAGIGSGAESLNAAIAASILASEFFRQNR